MRTVTPMTCGIAAAAVLACAACGPDELRPVAVQVRTADTADAPVADATVWVRGQAVTQTDGEGTALVTVTGLPGDVVPLAVSCPDGYRGDGGSRRVIIPAGADAGQTHEVAVTCSSSDRETALVVRTTLDDAPLHDVAVVVDGEVVGQTDREGTEHVLLRRRTGSRLSIALGAPAHLELADGRHVRSLIVGDHDSAALIERAFHRAARQPASKRTKRRPPSAAREAAKPFRIR